MFALVCKGIGISAAVIMMGIYFSGLNAGHRQTTNGFEPIAQHYEQHFDQIEFRHGELIMSAPAEVAE